VILYLLYPSPLAHSKDSPARRGFSNKRSFSVKSLNIPQMPAGAYARKDKLVMFLKMLRLFGQIYSRIITTQSEDP
jgi:hypothetical protein